MELEEHAIQCARQAGQLLAELFTKPLEVTFKSAGTTNPVTEADKKADEFLKEFIRKRYPTHGILTEESGNVGGTTSNFLWVLDPLDGTTNYLNRFPFYASSIGILHNGIPIAGSMYLGSSLNSEGTIFHARQGGGAWADDKRINVSANTTIESSRLIGIPSRWRERVARGLRQRTGEPRSMGSIAGELAYTASGIFQYSLFGAPQVWDAAAGVLLVKEAGGEVLTMPGNSRHWETLYSFADGGHSSTHESVARWRAPLMAANSSILAILATGMGRPTPFKQIVGSLFRRGPV